MRKIYLIIIMILILIGCRVGDKVELTYGSRVVVLGDSITNGYGVEKSYVDYLSEVMKLEFISLGQDGATTREGLKKVDEVIGYDPQLVIVELGGNDLLKKMNIDETKKNLDIIVDKLQEKGISVVVLKFYPKLSILNIIFRKRRNGYENIYEELSKRNNVYIVNNTWDNVWGKHMLDTIHPDSKGHEIMARNVEESLKKLIEIN